MWIRYGKSFKSSFKIRTMLIRFMPNYWDCQREDSLDFDGRATDNISALLSFDVSSSTRSSFVQIINSSISLKYLYNPPHSLSVRSWFHAKITLICSLSFYNRFGIKVEIYQFFSFLISTLHTQWIALKLHQQKFLAWVYNTCKNEIIQVIHNRLRANFYCGIFLWLTVFIQQF